MNTSNVTPPRHALARVNMFWQEAFVVGVFRGIVRDYVWAALQVERSSLFRGFWSEIAFRLRRPLVLTWPNVYITGGGD